MHLRCILTGHRYEWPDHVDPASVWSQHFRVECVRGCGARGVARCDMDRHWTRNHATGAKVSILDIDYGA